MPNAWDPRRWLTLSVIILATFMVVLDTFIVNVALPSIQQALHADFAKLQFIAAGYILGYAVLLITGGRLGDLYGRRRMFLIGVAGFVATSAWCGFAGSADMLIAARIFQGVSAAAMVPQVLSLIQVMFPPEEKGKALGIYGAVLGLGAIAGQLAGGLLLKANWWGMGWRLVFLVNIPVGILAFAFAVWLIRESRAAERKRLDTAGVGLVTAGLVLLIYPIVVGREMGWPWWTYASLAIAVAVLAVFVRFENGLQRRGALPLLPMGLFRDRSFRIGMLIALAFYSGNAALYLILSVFLQSGLGASPLQSAYNFIPLAAGFFLASLLAPPWKKRWGNRVLQAGAFLMIVGYAVLIGVANRSAAIGWEALIIPLFIAGFGQGAVASPLIHTILSGVQGPHAGAASGALSTFTQVAQAIGIAVIGTLYPSLVTHFGGEAPAMAHVRTLQWLLVLITALAALTFLMLTALGRRRATAAHRPAEAGHGGGAVRSDP
ncbi:MFS transporter [Cohnella nanjingensis]|uniref:MFS transporter n=1 Tax=Cohnella nanjingensis TaxID=1387779 RepID=A0A7X0VF84_9BACL|nr:MFS transporter [Cohnella nanjingensis]MBB6670344.1 MFS transporter [Cohnella nanjingensis]